MHLEDDDVNDLKSWVVVRLKDISDADSDVLADYILALIRTDTPQPKLRLDILENLEDFLKDNTTDFVNEIFQTLQTGSYKHGYVAPRHNVTLPNTTLPIPRSGPFGQPNQPSKDLRKRSYNDAGLDGPDPNSYYAPRGDRQMKQMRGRGSRGGRGSDFDLQRGGFQQGTGYNEQPAGTPHGFPALPNISDMPQFDPNDPMAAIMAMQAMGIPPLPGMEGLLPQQTAAQRPLGLNQNKGKGVCRDFVNKGYCTRGDACPYQHTNPMIMPGQQDEYDPKDSLITPGPFSPTGLTNGNHISNYSQPEGYPNESRGRGRGNDRGRGRGRGGNDRGGFHKANRAEFSQAGQNHDRSITTIVVEQIPEDKFSEEVVRQFFADFGEIIEITMQPYKRLAIIKYSDYSSARAAYDSPKVIFDNRFVKVYWYKPGSIPTPSPGTPALSASANNNQDISMKEPTPPLDMEAFTAAATAAQAKLDAKKAALAASQSQREALEKQKADLAIKQAAERQKLLDRLAAKGETLEHISKAPSNQASPPPNNNATNPTTPKAGDSAHTLMLRAKVAELEAEAKRLGLPDSALSSDTFSPRGRGRGRGRGARGSYRGWEAFDSSFSSYRGGRGGGGGGSPFVPARGGGGGKYNLDLRTRRVAVTLPAPATTDGEEKDGMKGRWTAERDEALRQFLLGIGEFEDIVPLFETDTDKEESGEAAETLVVGFKDRGTAEGFLQGAKGGDVPGLGKVGVSWYNGPTLGKASGKEESAGHADRDVDMGNGIGNRIGHGEEAGGRASGDKGTLDANGASDGAMPPPVSELKGGGPADVGGLGEGDYDVAEEDDDSWMT